MSRSKKKYYPLTDPVPDRFMLNLTARGLTRCVRGLTRLISGHHVMAEATGEKRPPRKGEWYLSGAIAEAYMARNDMSSTYLIAKLVVVKVTQTVTYVEVD